MKKKIKAIVLMLVCVFTLAACGNGEPKKMVEDPHTSFDGIVKVFAYFISRSDEDLPALMQELTGYAIDREIMASEGLLTDDNYESFTNSLYKQLGVHIDSRVFFKGILSYGDARELLGNNTLGSYVLNGMDISSLASAEDIEYDVKADEVIASLHFKTLDAANGGHDGVVEIIFDKNYHITSINVNTVLGLGESMERAAVNTAIGMGSVFIMLIVIAIIISLLKFVPMILDGLKGKPVEKTEESLDKTIAGIVEREEAQEIVEDDTELVAVIAAAIAASEGAASTEGFVVRSIRRVR